MARVLESDIKGTMFQVAMRQSTPAEMIAGFAEKKDYNSIAKYILSRYDKYIKALDHDDNARDLDIKKNLREICFSLKLLLQKKGFSSNQITSVFENIRKELAHVGAYLGYHPYKLLILDDAVSAFISHTKDSRGRLGQATFVRRQLWHGNTSGKDRDGEIILTSIEVNPDKIILYNRSYYSITKNGRDFWKMHTRCIADYVEVTSRTITYDRKTGKFQTDNPDYYSNYGQLKFDSLKLRNEIVNDVREILDRIPKYPSIFVPYEQWRHGDQLDLQWIKEQIK